MNFALDRLRALRTGKMLNYVDLAKPDSLPMDWRIDYEERAAILQYDGGLDRGEAEAHALQEIAQRIRDAERI